MTDVDEFKERLYLMLIDELPDDEIPGVLAEVKRSPELQRVMREYLKINQMLAAKLGSLELDYFSRDA